MIKCKRKSKHKTDILRRFFCMTPRNSLSKYKSFDEKTTVCNCLTRLFKRREEKIR